MAYISQEKKKELLPTLKQVLRKYGVQGTFSIRNHSALVCTITAARLPNKDWSDTLRTRIQNSGYSEINTYYLETAATGRNLEFLQELYAAMNAGNHDNSDIMTDYFDVGWYTYITFGKYGKPFIS